MRDRRIDLGRRGFVVGGLVLGGAALTGFGCSSNDPVQGGGTGPDGSASGPNGSPTRPGSTAVSFGPLVEQGDLALPEGFTAVRFGETGSALTGGGTTPIRPDGMAAFAAASGGVLLVRNHEVRLPSRSVPALATDGPHYDPRAGAGTVTLEVSVTDGGVDVVSSHVSLSGTLANCAGGATPWGSWLTCEEAMDSPAYGDFSKRHGYVFEVPAVTTGPVSPEPLVAMGRFLHEAAAVDPGDGTVYLTEDNGYDSGFYRFLPDMPGTLAAGGRLQQLAVTDAPEIDLAFGQRTGAVFPVEWVDIDDPDPESADDSTSAVFNQGFARGGARFKRLEGAAWDDGTIWFTATEGGDAGVGQVFAYRPARSELELVVQSTGGDMLDMPDNVTPANGWLVLCEDGSDQQMLRALTPDGALHDLAVNLADDTEWCGACFSPDGSTLFATSTATSPSPAAPTPSKAPGPAGSSSSPRTGIGPISCVDGHDAAADRR